jgi:HEAT repeat protein
MRLPGLPPLDVFSFWVGFAAAALLALLLYRSRDNLIAARQAALARVRRVVDKLTSGTERWFREEVLQAAQTQHVAGALFALDDVLLPPRVLAPAPPFDPNDPPLETDINAIIPIIPDLADLAATYRASRLSVEEALAGGGHLLILGEPGTGKSTLLAHLASRAARSDATLLPDDPTPIYVHAADFQFQPDAAGDPLQPLIAAAQVRASALIASRLPRHLRGRLRDHKCLILLDGLDEVPLSQVGMAAAWVKSLLDKHKQHRLVAAAGASGFGPLIEARLAPVWMAPWNADDCRALIGKWGGAWDAHVRSRRRSPTSTDTDPLLIMGWLGGDNQGRTILQLTLKIWAAFNGDSQGKRAVDWARSYVLRHGIKPAGEKALGKLALRLLAYEDGASLTRPDALAVFDAELLGPGGRPLLDSDNFLDDLLDRGLLVRRGNGIAFSHRDILACCAAMSMAADPEAAAPGTSAAWSHSLIYLAAIADVTALVARRLGNAPDLTHTDLLSCAGWLRDAPGDVRWRAEVLRRLSQVIRDTRWPEALRERVLAGFVASGDTSVSALFKHMLNASDPFARRLGALGLGAVRDATATVQLASHLTDEYLDVRWAAALALSVLNTDQAVEALGKGLLLGDDHLRQACAQALARHEEEGHPALREALAHEDLSVRRAAVVGLASINADWVAPLLETALRSEGQWLVQVSIQSALERLKDPAVRAPRPVEPPEAHGWLLAWAAEQGVGVPPGRPALEVLFRALREADEPIRRAAAELLGRLGNAAAARELYPLLSDPAPELRAVAFRALAHISAASGARLAPPA